MTTIRVTESICPECLNVLPATLFVEDDKVYMKKTCPDHGEFKDLVWGDLLRVQENYVFLPRWRST